MPLVTLIILVVALGIISRSDIGQAIADAIRHNSGASQGAAKRRELEEMRTELEHFRAELDEVHHHLQETAERLDFAERLLSSKAEPAHLEGRQ